MVFGKYWETIRKSPTKKKQRLPTEHTASDSTATIHAVAVIATRVDAPRTAITSPSDTRERVRHTTRHEVIRLVEYNVFVKFTIITQL